MPRSSPSNIPLAPPFAHGPSLLAAISWFSMARWQETPNLGSAGMSPSRPRRVYDWLASLLGFR
ncbi:hypothetical protein B0T26DRAFT_692293 [Lasiosphaeria miniovina]|uniref:Uncharacterized protein n=1 Tax=Lasiosphaeria miniovina TaxID=1954250 RepID=A0AA40E4M2_9PEZI|nr:uncharacterized protein B0T26DRAFT_692293 [Lasiosphaeria miniovina]KAK0726920.1 hypothetical protein B0T26DRAFT_692293 [Lasiosphaeria miniovina]